MLLELSIRDFAIIEATTIRFSDGLNVLTGETGAGKSILLDALGAVLGTRVSNDLVRTGANSARIEAAFAPDLAQAMRLAPVLADIGVEPEDDALVLSREVLASGRSTARINGRLTTATALSRIGSLLVDIHGQSDHLAILRTPEQRALLDRFAGVDSLREQVAGAVRQWREARARRQSIEQDSREREQRVDLLRFQLEEIEEAAFVPGEEERLVAERGILRNADQIRTDALQAITLLLGDELGNTGSASSFLRDAVPSIDDMAMLDGSAASLAERANEVLVLAEDLGRDVRSYVEGIESDEGRLADVDDRLALLQGLKRKYGGTIDEIAAFGERARQELLSLTSAGFDREALAAAETQSALEAGNLAHQLSQRRMSASGRLAAAVEESVSDLHMGRAALEIVVERRPDVDGLLVDDERVHVDESGIDHVEFLLAPNAGETLRPLARIASGGEMARLMLAIKSILSDVDLTPTLVFDEIDTGVGGRIGQVVGEKLWAISRGHQVIVVTHLPQIASFAHAHLRIEKEEQVGGRVVSTVRELNLAEREVELAAMIDGLPPGEAALLNAHTMLERARSFMVDNNESSGIDGVP